MFPSRGRVAPFAAVGPAETQVGRVRGPGQIELMAGHAVRVNRGEAPDPAAGMAALTRDRSVGAAQWESRAVVHRELPDWPPTVLLVAARTARTEPAGVSILMAPDAALRLERRDRAAIVVAT